MRGARFWEVLVGTVGLVVLQMVYPLFYLQTMICFSKPALRGNDHIFLPKREVGKIIDSKVPTGRGYIYIYICDRFQEGTWRIIPVSKWLVTIVSTSPK